MQEEKVLWLQVAWANRGPPKVRPTSPSAARTFGGPDAETLSTTITSHQARVWLSTIPDEVFPRWIFLVTNARLSLFLDAGQHVACSILQKGNNSSINSINSSMCCRPLQRSSLSPSGVTQHPAPESRGI